MRQQEGEQPSPLQSWLYPEPSELSEDFQMPIWDHLDELRERVLVAGLAGLVAVLACFCFSKELVVFLEAPVVGQGVKFLQLSPGEFFFTTLQVPGLWCWGDQARPRTKSIWGIRATSSNTATLSISGT